MSRIITHLALAGLTADDMRALYRDGRDTWVADLLGVTTRAAQLTRQALGVTPFERGGSNELRGEERAEFDRRWAWLRDAVSQGVRTG